MIITPHLLLGAAIGAKVKHFGWIIILGIVSHLILDRIPHWDYGERIENLPHNKNFIKRVFVLLFKITIDGLIGLIIIFFIIWQKDMIKIENLTFIIIGIAASVFPDLTLGIAKLLSQKFKKASRAYLYFHEKIFHCPEHILKPTPLGVGTQILMTIMAILILTFA